MDYKKVGNLFVPTGFRWICNPTELMRGFKISIWTGRIGRRAKHNAEVVEPSLGLFDAVADDEVIAAQGLVAHIESRSCVVSRSYGVAKNDVVLSVADADDALTQIIVEVHVDGLSPIARFDVRMAHVAVGKRAFDVDFVFVVNERVMVILLHARRN